MWGPRRDWGSVCNFPLGHVYAQFESFRRDPAVHTAFSVEKSWLMGFPVPEFQRTPSYDPAKPLIRPYLVNALDTEGADRILQPTWSEFQMIRFVEAAVEGRDLGTWTFHTNEDMEEKRPDGSVYHPMDGWLIDGQQRFWSLQSFFEGRFPVFGKLWDDVELADRRRFLNTVFTAYQLRNRSELELREAYDIKNFGGTAHTEDQRALPGFKG